MSQNELFAAAAHLHVVLRRKTGRVTDTEWMVSNAEYAQAMVRWARERAQTDGHIDLLPLADRLEALLALPSQRPRAEAPPRSAQLQRGEGSDAATDMQSRYIGRLR